jgi:SLOG in TRPM, prokaryote
VTATVRLGQRDVPLIRFTGPAPGPAVVAARLAAAGLRPGRRPVVVLVGGADGLRIDDPAAWTALFRDGLVAGLVRAGACLVDGGTDAGILALAGRARAAAGGDYPAVGVVADGMVRWPGSGPGSGPGAGPGRGPAAAGAAGLEPHHTHIVTVPGQAWGTEPPWISLIATALAGAARSLTVVINGGPITRDDVRHSLAAGRPVLAVTGTGRLADTLVGSAAPSPLLQAVDGLRDPRCLAARIADLAS